MTVFPNPAASTEELIVQFGETVDGDILIQMYNVSGTLVHENHVDKKTSTLEYKLRLKAFARGVYILRAENRGKETTQKVKIE